ncbi:Putative RNA polymerase II subunit B1 CTD phosphatase Rpap2 [Vanrija pseudolonga]|uniref:RNA polymerase II subunit B1 CTD phosphatase RPAP2 homolog n=1 Tax=Vanrija pseudolonga TaxID=143232 RepID=A0AAF0YEW1_9TREE|nr:Putative RNA polymerase II subunit B1 CTD phosphatase Rpap2 [Vanrija pseudolonga]
MQAGPSRLGGGSTSTPRAPQPQRTLKQPMSLGVAERSATPAAQSDAASLRRALERRAELSRRADKWMDRLMEEVVDRVAFQRALSYVHAKQYAEVEHERHLNNMCAYPLCPNPPAAPYRSQRRFVVSTRNRSITETEGNADEAFCSGRCRARSSWVRNTLGTEAAWIRGKVEPLVLLEDLEERGEVRWGGRRGDVLERVKVPGPEAEAAPAAVQTPQAAQGYAVAPDPATPTPAVVAAPASPATAAPAAPATTTATTAPARPTPARAPQNLTPAPTPAAPTSPQPIQDLIANLAIYERPTPTSKPLPPSLSPAAPPPAQEAVVPTAPPLPLPQRTSALTPPRRAAGASSMISSSSTKLASTLLAAAKALPPGVQDDSDAESSASEEDWAKEMGWGKGAEVDALFDEARAARDLLDEAA